jgi:DegV family protein with EDD domain
MRNFIVATDSSADLTIDEASENSIAVLRIKYLDGKVFKEESVEQNPAYKRFFDKLRNGNRARFITPSQNDYGEFFDALITSGKKNIIYVATSSKIGSDCKLAKKAAAESMVKFRSATILVLDSLSVGPAKAVIALRLAALSPYISVAEALVKGKEIVKNTTSFAIVYDLGLIAAQEYSPVMKVGLNIGVKPVLTLSDKGTLQIFKRAKSEKTAVMAVLKYAAEKQADKSSFFIYGADNTRNKLFAIKMLQEKFGGASVKVGDAGMRNGAYFAPNAIFIGFTSPRVKATPSKPQIKTYKYQDLTPRAE